MHAEMQQEAKSGSDFDFSDEEDEDNRRYVVRGAKNNPNAQSKEVSLGQLRKVGCNRNTCGPHADRHADSACTFL